MKVRGSRAMLVAAVAALAAVGILYLRDNSYGRTPSGTLDPAYFTGMAHEAYEIAAKYPKLLAQLHCYCGCGNDLLQCYRTTHASHCSMCMHEALDAETMYKNGDPVKEIRERLRAMYQHAGE